MNPARSAHRGAAPQLVSFIENAAPPLQDTTYRLLAEQTVPGQDPGTFRASATFVVAGERFTIRPAEIDSVFPPDLANGEFDGVLAHVVLSRSTLPWERQPGTPGSADDYPGAPWLAVLVCDAASAPPLQHKTAKDLVQQDAPITVPGSAVTGTGALPATILSYGAALLGKLSYGETPDDPCTVIDLPVAQFSQIAPAAADLRYLAHIRAVDTTGAADGTQPNERHAVIVANRIPAPQGRARAFLVSLEGMADYLPRPDGTPSQAIGQQVKAVRLIAYRSWTFTVNDMDETLEKLLLGLNTRPDGSAADTVLMLPVTGVPSQAQLRDAMTRQAAGTVSAEDASVLMRNALLMGYVPMNHHLRHGGRTVSFYRGPFVPLPAPAVTARAAACYSGPDAAAAYDPQTGLFDVSYAAAWQLGQLLALQSTGLASQLYQWKHAVTRQESMAAEEALLTMRLAGARVFPSVLGRRRAAAAAGPPPLPDQVVTWFGNLASLHGVPFSYLVPDERMLPPESVRFFHVDQNWIDALIDGAFSIGRQAVSDQSIETRHAAAVRQLARSAAGRRRASRLPASAAPFPAPGAAPGAEVPVTGAPVTGAPVTGFVLRSQAVAGWPNLRISGYRDAARTDPAGLVRLGRLSGDTLLCLFDRDVTTVSLREPPEQLHHGVRERGGEYYTTLRSVAGGPGPVPAGKQYDGPLASAPVPVRADGRTIRVCAAAQAMARTLSTAFAQPLPSGLTAAEFALEMTQGVVEVEFSR